jgi:hypothetical protein
MDGSVVGILVFGYSIPLRIVLIFIALVVGLLITVSFCLTIGLSVYRSIKKSRRDRVRPDLRTELLDRLFVETPGWNEWVEGLTSVERDVVESLLDEHLRELEGNDADTLRELGNSLGIPKRAARQLKTGTEHACLEALTWLTVLQRPEPYLESSFEPETPRERAAVVTLLQQTDRLPDEATGVSILLDGIDAQFTVFGQDTLYRVARIDPAPLLRSASDAYNEWPESLLVQVLAVCAHLETSVREGEFAWLIPVLESGNEATRAAAARALGSFGWQNQIREQAVLERAVRDPSPHVRAAVYQMLASWGDERALSALHRALVEEKDSRALTVGTKALVGRRDRLETDLTVQLGHAWTWSIEHCLLPTNTIPTADGLKWA